MRFDFRTRDQDVAIDVVTDGDDWRLTIDGRQVPLQIRQDAGGAWLVQTHQGRRRLWVAARGDERLVFCDGRVHRMVLPDPEHDDETEDAASGLNLSADMPGKIVKVLVKVGDTVETGQTVLIMESMKMETEMVAVQDATVSEVHVTGGQVVGQGDALVDLEALE